MDSRNPVAIQRIDYQAPRWSIEKTSLVFELDPKATRVSSELYLEYAEDDREQTHELILQGVDLVLLSISIDDRKLEHSCLLYTSPSPRDS